MPYLIDTDVLSELRKSERDRNVVNWLESMPGDQLRLSVITVGELWASAQAMGTHDPAQAEQLRTWCNTLDQRFRAQLVPVSAEIADMWGRLDCSGELPVPHGLIATTAKVHGWTVVTRNVADFERAGVALLNPFEPASTN